MLLRKAETRTEVPLESLVEVKARVSRFHREAVEDELLAIHVGIQCADAEIT